MNRESVGEGLTFRGLIGLYDSPRPESAAAVRESHEAGISVHMLTGDHPETAKASLSMSVSCPDGWTESAWMSPTPFS